MLSRRMFLSNCSFASIRIDWKICVYHSVDSRVRQRRFDYRMYVNVWVFSISLTFLFRISAIYYERVLAGSYHSDVLETCSMNELLLLPLVKRLYESYRLENGYGNRVFSRGEAAHANVNKYISTLHEWNLELSCFLCVHCRIFKFWLYSKLGDGGVQMCTIYYDMNLLLSYLDLKTETSFHIQTWINKYQLNLSILFSLFVIVIIRYCWIVICLNLNKLFERTKKKYLWNI